MRKQRIIGSSGRNAIKEAVEQLFGAASTHFGQSGLQGRPAFQLRVRLREPFAGVVAVIPDVLGGGDHPGEPLGALAFRSGEPAPAFVSSLRNNTIEQSAGVLGRGTTARQRKPKGT